MTTVLDPGTPPQVLMCAPDYFEVTYAINPWMTHGESVDLGKARDQWQALRQAIQDAGAEVLLAQPVPGLPDMVFTANAAQVNSRTRRAVIASYRHPERQPEEDHMEAWFKAQGYETLRLPREVKFEGSGDALMLNGHLFSGYRQRTSITAHAFLSSFLNLPVLSLELTDPRFYHVDVCMCPTDKGDLLLYPPAFDEYALKVIEAEVPAERRITVDDEEAFAFACNAVSVGDTLILNQGAPQLTRQLQERGYRVVAVDMSEFIKSGGSCKCLTLRLQ